MKAGSKQKAGEQIPGSKYFREYCYICGDAIRVPEDLVGRKETCHLCDHRRPAPHTGTTPRQKLGLSKTDA
jgi:hypothetical protein